MNNLIRAKLRKFCVYASVCCCYKMVLTANLASALILNDKQKKYESEFFFQTLHTFHFNKKQNAKS